MAVKKFLETIGSRCNQGFTLIEVMIALAIFAIGFLALSSMQITAINTNANARNSTTVITIAKDRAEELMALPYDDADLVGSAAPGTNYAPAADVDLIDNDEDGQIDEAGETGHITITWTVIDDQPLPGTKSVRVTAIRTARGQRRASFDFIKANM
jgi:type IV pilus assembly protein PilV